MLSLLFNYKGYDLTFTVIRCLTILTFIGWPPVVIVSIMALSGRVSSSDYGMAALIITSLFYPLIFMAIVTGAEKYLIDVSYPLALILALIPLIISSAVLWKLFLAPKPEVKQEVISRRLEIGKQVQYNGFYLEYLGKENGSQGSVTISTDRFKAVNEDGTEQTIEIVTGQTPPAPIEFIAGGKKFSLSIYEKPDGEKLLPGHYVVVYKGSE